jgi:hypothetical protein
MWQFGVIVLVVALYASVVGHSSQPGDGKESGQDPFAGKLLLVTTSNNQNTLKNVQVRKLGERTFLVGVAMREEIVTREPFAGRTLWLPVSEVVEIVEFDDLGQLKRFSNSRQPGQP